MESVPKMKNCEKQTKVMPYKQLFFLISCFLSCSHDFWMLVILQVVTTIYSERLVKIQAVFSITSNFFDLSWNVNSIFQR